MEEITTWFTSLPPTLRLYWGIAIFATVVFAIQTVMSFVGIGEINSGDVDVDFDTSVDNMDNAGAMSLLSIRNVFYFLLGFGWTGISLWDTVSNRTLLALAACVVGCAFVALFMFLFGQMMRLQSNGTFRINDSVDKVCDVYLRIPANGQGLGKVQISFGGSVQELDARTDGEFIPSGSKVRVLRVVDNNVLEVEKA